MKTITRYLHQRLLAVLLACFATSAIAAAREERDPQSCGMMNTPIKKKRNNRLIKTAGSRQKESRK